MVGGGQLARMTHQAAIALGQTLRVLATAADDPAAQVTPDVVIGSHTDLEDLRRVAAGADALTFDHEHVPTELLDKLVADGVNVAPPPQALVHAQDKLVMRRRLEALGAPVPRYVGLDDPASLDDDLDAFARRGRFKKAPLVVKAVRGGYDGRGVRMARDVAHAREIAGAYLADGVPVLVEERVELRRELSALVARSPFGQGAAWPVVETVQRDGICVLVIAPAPELPDELAAAAQQLALRLAAELGVVGVLAVELFETTRRRAAGQRAGDAAAQLRPLDHGRGTHQPVRAAPARGAGLSARRYRCHRAGDGDGQRAGRPAAAGDDRRRTVAPPVRADARRQGSPLRQGGTTRPQGRPHQLSSASDMADLAKLRERAELAAHWLSHGQWTDGWDPHDSR